jgi:hypothetical protein
MITPWGLVLKKGTVLKKADCGLPENDGYRDNEYY